jgi:peroxiredoxin
MTALRYGQPAPDFALPSTDGRTVTLAEFRGRADVVLVFYCYDWGRI